MHRLYMTVCDKGGCGAQADAASTGMSRETERELGRGLLRRGLREMYGIELPRGNGGLEKGLYGKPFLKAHPHVHFNISHSGRVVVCALSDQPIGVDVERVRPVRAPLIRRTLHEEELAVLCRFGEIDGTVAKKREAADAATEGYSETFLETFFRYWTLKESYLKKDGSGLTKDLRDVRFRIDPEEWDAPVNGSDPEVICRQRRLRLEGETGTETYVLAVCEPCG